MKNICYEKGKNHEATSGDTDKHKCYFLQVSVPWGYHERTEHILILWLHCPSYDSTVAQC